MKLTNNITPRELGYRMPAEWERQDAVWVAWPHNEDTWPGMIKEVESSYVQFVKAIYAGQMVKILVNDKDAEIKVMNELKKVNVDLSQIIFYKIKTADAWIRDYGPTFIVNINEKMTFSGKSFSRLGMVKWLFNAWGNKYEDLKRDNIIPYEINKRMNLPVFEPGIVLEGGSIEVNGRGTVITTEQCLLNKNRNPGLSKKKIEGYLKDYLNASQILWLKNGIAGDDTDGHIDDIARFVNNNTVVCAFEDDKDDDNYGVLKENYEMLNNMNDERGNRLNVIKLPMPEPIESRRGRLPASYANFYIGNATVAVPVFGSRNDQKALKILQTVFPERKVIGINCKSMVHGLGTLHCCTQQEPCA